MVARSRKPTSQAAVAATATATAPATIPTTTTTTAPSGSAARKGTAAVQATPSPARFDTNPADATKPVLSSSTASNSTILFYQERPGPMSTTPDHRPNQPFQGAAPLRPVSQPPNLNSNQPYHQQQQYQGHGVFSPQTGLQSPYLNNPQSFPPHPQAGEGTYYTSNPSPRSTTSAAYYPTDKPEPMATATATMQRPYAQIYHTPQSNSPVSVTSPQTHDHGRPMYSQQASQMPSPMYGYQNYPPMAPVHPAYSTHHHQPPQMNSQPMLSYPPNPSPMSQPNMTSQPSTIQSSPRIKDEGQQIYTPQSQASLLPQRHPTAPTPAKFENPPLQAGQPPAPPATSNAAPGPIPATTPLVVRQDNNGVQWIAFEYSRDRVKLEYTIRCDVESVDANQLSQDFKGENCVYPRACVPKDQYKGNRLAYETDCNQVGWALAELNPCLRGKRGLIQRAVDSWRNSNQDPRLRSRRVRRQHKMQNRSKAGALNSQGPGPGVPTAAGHPGPGTMNVPVSRPPGNMSTSSQQALHQNPHDASPTGQESAIGLQYSNPQGLHQSNSTHVNSPSGIRHARTFPAYPSYPSAPTTLGPMPPSMPGTMHGYGRAGANTTMSSRSMQDDQDETDLYGNLPEAKRRKFIQVDDAQKNARVRVKVTLDQVDLSEIPDSYRKQNSVFPRAYFPTQMHSMIEARCASRYVDVDDVGDADSEPPMIGKTTVPCHLKEGDGELEVSQLSRHRKDRERKLNELGYRMAWSQSRIFANRHVFLGRALDVFRNKQRSLLQEESDSGPIPSHLETRAGKRRWQERISPICDGPSPQIPGSS